MPEKNGSSGYFTQESVKVRKGKNSMDLAAAFKENNPDKDYVVANTSKGSRIIQMEGKILPAGEDARHLNLG